MIFSRLTLGAGAVLGAALAIAPAYFLGKRAGNSEAATAALEKTIELIHSRDVTNAEISAADAAELCRHFGLSDDDTEQCVRGLAEASTQPGDVGNDPADGSPVR